MAWWIATFASILTLGFTQTNKINRTAEERILVPPPLFLEHFHFGFSQNIADSLWLGVVQDIDYPKDRWLYQMLEATTNLAPDFRIAYAIGGVALSVIISDIESASLFFDKSIKAFPNDWPILYRAAYHALYEEKDNKKAADLLIRAARNGAPPWAYSLATRLLVESDNKELAMRLYQDLEKSDLAPDVLARMREKLGLPSLTQ